ncbi:hypothetical protein CH063_02850 [Colletotrichum higginsianum]|uniref:Uncharacterized protein n=1 Tax=Colletotrichum higginsianum (strain IMI 349063) TaxID=759273 RepID=H1VQJ5_COLHI|nr:hypothetical protein CH63R_06003 [Colletotrichum higginsianum IMI 349063]OBR10311.1 hypothetical protein CH63R_06003 [Colletotrichum higginsianum IMI 349063]CCF42501.1 hypothetical protein CH063_02850 [Colletotrichum higginsianum]
MSGNQKTKERLSKRSLTPNRPLYESFNEAHRHIAPATPKLPIDEEFCNEEQLTPEQVEDILHSSSTSRELEEHAKTKYSKLPIPENQSGHETKSINLTSSAIESQSQTKATDHGPHESVSPCDSDDENAFVDSSISSIHKSNYQINQQGHDDNPFEGQQKTFDHLDSSSFYPEEGADYELPSTDEEFAYDKVKLEPNSSPALASSPTLHPPIVSDSKYPSPQLPQSHLDDVTKKEATSGHLDSTHLSGQNGTQYPIFIDRGVLPPPSIPATQPFPAIQHVFQSESQYDGDISEVSKDQFIGQNKGKPKAPKASASRLNPFHAFSATSSHTSDTNPQPSEPENKKVFLRPHAEKEVSQALHHVTGLSLPSSGLIVRQGLSSRTYDSQQSPYRTHAIQQKDDFYHAPAIQPDWQITQSGLKVPVSTSHNEDETNMQATEPYSPIDNTRMATVASGDTEDRTGLEGDEDWRTVTDDREFPPGTVGRVMTGSSIANVSDALLVQHKRRTAAAPAQRRPSATKAWWESGSQMPSLPSRSPSPTFPAPPGRIFQHRQRRNQGWEEIELEPMPTPYRDFSWQRIRAEREQAQQAMEATQAGGNVYANLPFPLIAREDAARRQAVRRASGLEDQTLSGRILSPGLPLSSQGGSSAFPLQAIRKNSARSMFSRINNPNFDCRKLSMPEVTARYRAMQAVRQIGGQGTDSELADMAATVGDLPLSGVAARRQKAFYIAAMVATCLFPFVGFALLACSADKLLAGVTRGECSGLSFHQRRNLRIMLLVGCGVWVVSFVAGLITLLALRN